MTWALEVGEVSRFGNAKQAISHGERAVLRTVFGRTRVRRTQRLPISKQRDAHLQAMLVEAAIRARRWNVEFALLHARAVDRGATSEVGAAAA